MSLPKWTLRWQTSRSIAWFGSLMKSSTGKYLIRNSPTCTKNARSTKQPHNQRIYSTWRSSWCFVGPIAIELQSKICSNCFMSGLKLKPKSPRLMKGFFWKNKSEPFLEMKKKLQTVWKRKSASLNTWKRLTKGPSRKEKMSCWKRRPN